MLHSFRPTTFAATGNIQLFVVPATGNYLVVAAGAAGGAGERPGGKGAVVEGIFYLRQSEVVNVVVGSPGEPGRAPAAAPDPATAACGGGGGGGTFVWKSTATGAIPEWPLLVAAGGGGGGKFEGGAGRAGGEAFAQASTLPSGHGGSGGLSDPCWHFAGGGGAGWLAHGANGPGPVFCEGGKRWAGGEGPCYNFLAGGSGGFGGGGAGGFLGHACGGGGGFSGGAGGGLVETGLNWTSPSTGGVSYNGGRNQVNHSGRRDGYGYATITPASPFYQTLTFPRWTRESLLPPVRISEFFRAT